MSLVRFYVAELKTRDREVERLRAELEHVRKTRREAIGQGYALGVVDGSGGRDLHTDALFESAQAQTCDIVECELDAREEK